MTHHEDKAREMLDGVFGEYTDKDVQMVAQVLLEAERHVIERIGEILEARSAAALHTAKVFPESTLEWKKVSEQMEVARQHVRLLTENSVGPSPQEAG